MAEKKNNPSDAEEQNAEDIVANASGTPDGNGIADKLQDAAGNISRADENSRIREDEAAKRLKAEQKEKQAKAAKDEKQRRLNEREVRKNVDARLAELEYAESVRKKLEKEKKKAEKENALRRAEERAAAQKAADEARAQRIAELLEDERQRAAERGRRADAILGAIAKRNADLAADAALKSEAADSADDDAKIIEGIAKAIHDAEETDAAEAERRSADPDEEDTDSADVIPSVDDSHESDGGVLHFGDGEENVTFVSSDDSEDEPSVEDDDEDDGVLGDVAKWFRRTAASDAVSESVGADDAASEEEVDADGESSETDDGDGSVVDDEDDEIDPLDEIPSVNSHSASDRGKSGEASEDALKNFRKKSKHSLRKKKKNEPLEEVPFTADDAFRNEDVVEAIKAEGKLLRNTKLCHKRYSNNSRQAIKDFTKALDEGRRVLASNRDEGQTPEILVSLMKISAKIVEIRCDNLENYARTKSYDYIRDARIALHRDINEYNEFAAAFSSLTGEQLTRLSTFLPDSIATGKALAVVPKLTYKENFVEVHPDADGRIPNEDGAVLTTVIPPETAKTLFEIYGTPSSRSGCASYRRKANRAIKILRGYSDKIKDALSKTHAEERRYKEELKSIEARTPVESRSSEEYRRAVIDIRVKYGKRLTSVETSKTKDAFAKTKLRLLFGCFAVERERLVIAYELLRETYKKGSQSQKDKACYIFNEAVAAYNKYARRCSQYTGVSFTRIPSVLVEQVCRGKGEFTFPIIAYKRELIERVGDTSRAVSMALRDDVAPNEKVYLDSSQSILGSSKGIRDSVSLDDDAPIVDRASSVAKVVIDALRESADAVVTVDEFELFTERSEKALKFFRKSLKRTERAISDAFDENGVVTALVENLRVISNIIEVRRINISLASKLKRGEYARSEGRSLYKEIELYNGRAIDYMSIVGEQFTRITAAPINVLAESADKLRVPLITYKDNYIEVFPKDPLEEPMHEKPTQRRGGYYTPLLMKHFRLTENRAAESTVVNSPFVFEVTVDDMPVESWWHSTSWGIFYVFQPLIAVFRRTQAISKIWFIKTGAEIYRDGLDLKRENSERRRVKLKKKLEKLNSERNAKIVALESVVHDSDRSTASYQKQINKINTKFSRKAFKLKMRWMGDCPAQTEVRWMLERLVLDRELLIGVNKVLIKFRNYGRLTFTKNILSKYKKLFLEAINEHNETARKLSKLVGIQFSEVSSNVADEIIRYGRVVRFPQLVCFREIIETVGDVKRSVGDKWHGYGLYSDTGGDPPSGTPPIMSVGAMGYSTEMGIPYFNADFNSMSIIGMTPKGVPLIGFGNGGEVAIPFSGIPMMLKGGDESPSLDAGVLGANSPLLGAVNAANPYAGVNTGSVDSVYVDRIEDKARNGARVETPIDVETAMVNERFLRSLGARSMTMIDGVRTWWKLLGSEINLRIQRHLFLRRSGFLRILLPDSDDYLENVNGRVPFDDVKYLSDISKLGSIIDIEISRLYAATKVGIRRSQRQFSLLLNKDIERYNSLVEAYNKLPPNPNHVGERRENEKLRPLSYSIPDRVRHRLDDRPPSPPHFSFRNRVRSAPFGWSTDTPQETEKDNQSQRVVESINTDNIVDKLYQFVATHPFKYKDAIRIITLPVWGCRLLRIKSMYKKYVRNGGKPGNKLVTKMRAEVADRLRRTYRERSANESRHFYIRYEKARAMKRFNKRMLVAVGVSDDPIAYQKRRHRVLRDYVSSVFRIDYNMRIYQLIERMLSRMNPIVYFVGLIPLFLLATVARFALPFDVFMPIAFVCMAWAAIPVLLLVLLGVYWIVYVTVWLFRMIFGNKAQLRYGAKDVENNRYSLVLDCFVCEQYKVLAAAAALASKPGSNTERKKFVATVNDYNKKIKDYSDILRIFIHEIEPTALMDKLISGKKIPLTEIQNFYYVRELVQINGEHDVGNRIDPLELNALKERLNQYLSAVSYGNPSFTRDSLVKFTDTLSEFITKRAEGGVGIGLADSAEYLKSALAEFDFIRLDRRAEYRNAINQMLGFTLRKRRREELSELLWRLDGEVAQVRDVLGDEALERFKNNMKFILNERASDASTISDEERFRVKEEIVNFVENYPLDNTVIRQEVARDFIKFIDDIGGLPRRVIISSLALDNMIY